MKGAADNFRPWLKKKTHSNKLSDDIKKIPLTSTRKVSPLLVDPDQNLGINKIPLARPIFV